jgi:hypothetical protein
MEEIDAKIVKIPMKRSLDVLNKLAEIQTTETFDFRSDYEGCQNLKEIIMFTYGKLTEDDPRDVEV